MQHRTEREIGLVVRRGREKLSENARKKGVKNNSQQVECTRSCPLLTLVPLGSLQVFRITPKESE